MVIDHFKQLNNINFVNIINDSANMNDFVLKQAQGYEAPSVKTNPENGRENKLNKKIRRGRNKKKKKICEKWVVYHANIRGFASKATSLATVLDDIKPNVICLNEHGLRNRQKMVIDNYNSYNRNRQNSAMGGVSISVFNNESKFCVKTSEGKVDNEYLIVRHDQFNPPINIFTVYGETESRTSEDKSKSLWAEILEELIKIKNRNEQVLLIGDMNKHIGNDELGIRDNHSKISRGGPYVRSLLKSREYILVNNCDKVEGGPFTRFDPEYPDDDDKKSCLDFVIVSRQLFPFIDKLFIDNNGAYTAKRVTKTKIIKPDHYPLIVTFKNIPMGNHKVVKQTKEIIWNTNKKGRWESYKAFTTDQGRPWPKKGGVPTS